MKNKHPTHAGLRLARMMSVALVALALAVLAAYWVNRLANDERIQEATLVDMEHRAAALTNAVAEQTRSVVYNLDLALLHLQQQRANIGTLDINDLKDILSATPKGLVRRVTIINAAAEITLVHPALPGPRTNLADRPYFRAHADPITSGLYIGPPIQSRFTDEWLIPLSRRLINADGEFVGVALLVVAPEYFAEIYGRLAAGREDVVALVRSDGAFLSRNLNLLDHLGKSVRADRPFIADHSTHEGVFRSISTHEPVDRVFAWRRLDEWPLVVVIGLSVGENLATINAGRTRDLVAAGTVTLLVVGLVAGVSLVLLRLARNVVRLSETEQRLAMAFSGASELAWEWDLKTRQLTFFGDCQSLLGSDDKEVRIDMRDWVERIDEAGRDALLQRTRQAIRDRADGFEFDFRVRHADASLRWVLVRGRTVRRTEAGEVERLIGILLDVDAAKRAEMLAAQTRESYARLIENAAEGIFVVDGEGRIEIFNPSAEHLLGLKQADARGTRPCSLIVQPTDAGEQPPTCPVAQTLADGLPRRGQRLSYRHGDGHPVPVELSVAPTLVDGQTVGAVVVFADNSDRLAREAELESLAHTDMLTGVANRRYFVEQCEREVYRSDRESSELSLVMLDLDHFKSINDRHGHAAGDAVLAAVARRCVGELRQIDVFGRLGGEEFGAALPGVDAGQAALVAERLRQSLAALVVDFNGIGLGCTASLGVATRRPGEDLDRLMARADSLLYSAKDAGRNRIAVEQPPSVEGPTDATSTAAEEASAPGS